MAKIRIPQKIKIGGQWISIFYEPKIFDNYGKMGQARFPEGEIALQYRDTCEDGRVHTLIHELLHWIDSIYNNYQLDETQTNSLASGLHALLVDLGIEFDWSSIKELSQ